MKAVRLLAILSRLQARGSATAQDLADAHEVSIRTIYRDIDALSAAGFPVYGDAGPGGGFRLLDVPTQRLTGLVAQEVEAMLLIGLPGPAAALGLGAAVNGARDKLLLRLSGAGQAQAERLSARFHLDSADWYRSAATLPLLPSLARAVLDDRYVSFVYDSWTQQRAWTVGPLGLILKGGDWYLAGQDGARILTFRVAAMERLVVLADQVQRPPGFDLAAWWQQAIDDFEARLRPHRARLRLSPQAAVRLSELGTYAADAVAAGVATAEGLEVDLPYEDVEQAARLILGLGMECRIAAPDELRETTRMMAEQIARTLTS